MLKSNKHLAIILLAVTLLLLIPLIAMQFTNDVKWTVLDFIVAGVLLFSAVLMCAFVIIKVKKVKYRIIICMALLTALLLIWLELAIGIFGTPTGGS